MNDLDTRIDNLSPEQRAKFEALLNEKKNQQQLATNELEMPQIDPQPQDRYKPFPLTDIQQAQWFGRSGIFSITVAGHGYAEFDCAGKDLDLLEKAFNQIIDEHEQMRMLVLPNLQQQVLESVDYYRFKRYDMRGKSEQELQVSLDAVRERMSHEILPSDVWPIFEVCATLWDDNLRLHFNFDLLVGDAWSFRVIIDEWARIYDDPDNYRPSPKNLSYRDYVLALEELESSPLFERDLAYWQEQLVDLPPPLPMIATPEEITEVTAEHYSIVLDEQQWTDLKAVIQQKKLTPSGFFASAFSEVISLWNSVSQHTLNMTVFNRLPLHPDVNQLMVGEFNSFQLVKVDNKGERSLQSRAVEVQSLMWQHLEHRSITGVRLMRELTQMTESSVGEAIMPVVFTSTLAHHEGETDMPTLAPGKWVYEVSQTPQVWMEHHLWEEDSELALHIDVVAGLFPDGLMEDFVATYESLIQRLIYDDSAWQRSSADYLLPDYQSALWEKYNETKEVQPTGLLHSAISKTAKVYADKVAVFSSRGDLTYGQLDDISSQLGNYLYDQVEVNELVAIVAPKGWEQVAAAIGILKSGAAYLPVEQDQPTDRLHEILASGQVKHVVTTRALMAEITWPEQVQCISFDCDAVTQQSTVAAPQRQTQEDVAYVIYTSGSTGKPKGVTIDHLGALNTIVDMNDRFNVTHDDVIFAISALSFDLSVYDIFGCLAVGATLVMPQSQLPDPKHWLSLAEQHQITVWNSVPALLEMFVDYAEEQAETIPDSLRLSLLSGDWIPLTLPDKLQLVNFDMDVISLGGATEASIWSIYHPIKQVHSSWSSIPYGKPLKNQMFYVLNDDLEVCPLWVTGNLYIGGIGVAKGYWNDKERTDAAFIIHPKTGERLYRTGDMGRLRPEGWIEFMGRNDTQVKIRGFRVELGEIESVLSQIGSLKHSIVVTAGESNQNRQLVAYLVAHDVVENTIEFIESIKDQLRAKLPDYMIPENVQLLDSLPLTANGKVDKKNLPKFDSLETDTVYVAASTDVEIRVVEIWQHLLKVEKIGVHDDFFRLGGNSLVASNLLYKLNEVFSVDLPLSELFEATTVAQIAALIEQSLIAQLEAMSDDEIELLEDF
ncbi:non-ribosomal peptide synthetase [Pseudoalteromonas aurantia]|uniref:Pyochelin synthetase n=1 Tax=Pseudoalteromonas aurantia 208 TaxID=1314867 RepID=A0ABR9EEW5_9GAMM|nr:non-ribosomal peptide synthetase [Pseudoalteromonas aurantia]MBE0369474.1 pyochelin synthetase [Pseudoalteromonas aurantia 208]